jgi:MoaA/NifB/PqqE/SkfB family radical SAM enzyme
MVPLDSARDFLPGEDAPPLPRFVQIEPVGQCNLRCEMCAIQFRRDGARGEPLA